MGPLNSLFCPEGGLLYTMTVRGEGFLPFRVVSWGLSGGGGRRGMVLDEIDSCIIGAYRHKFSFQCNVNLRVVLITKFNERYRI